MSGNATEAFEASAITYFVGRTYGEHTMIPLEIRDLIDQSVHSVIHEAYHRYPDGLESRCSQYAIVGAKCLCRLTGESFLPVSGSQRIPLADGGTHCIRPPDNEIERAARLSEIRNYHCWIQRTHEDAVEVIDFTLRNNDRACRTLGIASKATTAEPYAWVCIPYEKMTSATPEDVYFYASCLSMDAQLTELLWEFQFENDRIFEVLTNQAMLRIVEALETTCQTA